MSIGQGKRPKPLKEKELRKLLHEAIGAGSYNETFHARFDHAERKIDLNDVLYGLDRQWTLKGAAFDDGFWQWRYEIATEDIEGNPLTVIVAVDPRNRSFEVITRWNPQ